METKICKYCGEAKPLNEFRRRYTAKPEDSSAAAYYNCCDSCEQLESRRKYLAKKKQAGTASATDLLTLEKINKLYAYRREDGLRTQGQGRPPSGIDSETLDGILKEMEEKANAR